MYTAHDKKLQKTSDKDYRSLLTTLGVEEHLLQEINDVELERLYQRLHLAMHWRHLRYEPLQCKARWQIEVLSGQGEYYKNILFYDNLRDNWESTPLHYAVWHGSKEVFEWIDTQPSEFIKFLLGLKDKKDRTLFHYAAWSGTKEAYDWINSHPKEVLELRDKDNRTPIHFAAWSGTMEAFGWINTISSIEDLTSIVDYANGTPFHYAAKSITGLEWIKAEHQDIFAFYNHVSRTLFHWGASTGKIEIFDWIYSHYKFSLNCKLIDDVTPLHYGAINGGADVLDWIDFHFDKAFGTDLLLLHSAAQSDAGLDWINVNYKEALKLKDKTGRTCLHYAAWFGKKESIDRIIALQKDALALQDDFGRTPVHYAGIIGVHQKLNHALTLTSTPNSLTLCPILFSKFLPNLVETLKSNYTLTHVNFNGLYLENSEYDEDQASSILVLKALERNKGIKRDKVKFIAFMQGVFQSNNTMSLLNFGDLELCNSILRHILPAEIETASIFKEIKAKTNKSSRALTIINQEIERLEVSNKVHKTILGFSMNAEYQTSGSKIACLHDLKNKIEANPADLTTHVTTWETQNQAIITNQLMNEFSFFGKGLNNTQKAVQNIKQVVGAELIKEPPQDDLMEDDVFVLLY